MILYFITLSTFSKEFFIKRKRLSGALLGLALMLCYTGTAFASGGEIQVASFGCPQCGTQGNPITTQSRIYKHQETFPCSHGSSGNDRYNVYEVTKVSKCRACGYTIYTNTMKNMN